MEVTVTSGLAMEVARVTGEEREPVLGREDWLAAALELLMSEGVEAIRITRLAKMLGVTRGSFYWHFEDRDDLLSGCIDFWRRKNTRAIQEAVAGEQDLKAGVFALFAAWMTPGRFDPALDMAVRDWAKRSETVRGLLQDEDSQRLRLIADFLERCGLSRQEAKVRAQIIYYGQIGYFVMGVELPLEERFEAFPLYFESFTGQPIGEADVAPYREEITRRIRAAEG
jgi:AcrR family transcriptional regulator